ncbi:universal stress protein UspE [Ferrimonas lipolytica]|uniref:Universal stress protein UspE n=1 Tax=Ferrimonas lipolytica TaxID=2724191 RepID=A0A6H1UDC3_9GAMM|nr:universal stress protein UspE [Ferrimonas lipolytica]QIZ76590.1 universal stress protein UspE [Ferrimonas lipolytica]
MSNYQHILVVIDPSKEEQGALNRAQLMAQRCNGQLTLFMSIFDFSYEMTSMLSAEDRETLRDGIIDQRQRWLEQLAAPLREKGLNVLTKLCWHNRPFESIIQHALTAKCDMIVKSTHVHAKLKSVIFTPTDWSLMRKAPMPVLLVKEHDWSSQGAILVAVNVAAEDEDHRSLNDKLIKRAQSLVQFNDAPIHLVNGYPGTPVNIAIELPDFDAHAYNNSLRTHHEERIYELGAHYQLGKDRCHVLEGMPEDVIPDLAKEMNASIVIIGTIGRSGLSAALIGNTAEHVIDQIDCDLLTEKPASFVSPVANN